jgi:cell division septation protein DedD
VDEPRTHYQISLTARQAVGLFVGLLLALGLAFFFGLMSGLSGRDRVPAEPEPIRPEKVAAAPEPMPAVETAVPTAVSRGPSHTDLAGENATPAPAAEPTIPPTLQTFEDGTAEEAAATAAAVPAKPSAEAARPAPHAGKAQSPSAVAAGKFWVQVASLTSHDEAGALQARLSKHGFHTAILSAPAPRGGKVYRVRVGPYKSEEEAGRAAAKLGKQEKLKSPWVVPDGK